MDSRGLVEQQASGSVVVRRHDVGVAIVIDVSERGTERFPKDARIWDAAARAHQVTADALPPGCEGLLFRFLMRLSEKTTSSAVTGLPLENFMSVRRVKV